MLPIEREDAVDEFGRNASPPRRRTDAPGLAASPDGPHLIATTSAAAFSVQLALAVMLTAICALTLKRGARSLRIARR